MGAVFDVRQTCARRPDGAAVAITNVVTVRVPAPPAPQIPIPMPFPTIPLPDRPVAVRVTQRFAAAAMSLRRLETKLRESVVDVLRGDADDDQNDTSVRIPTTSSSSAFGGIFAAPIQIAAALAEAVADATSGGSSPSSGGVAASLTQPGADAQPPKTQQITHLSELWRVTRDDSSYSVYSRAVARKSSAEEAQTAELRE